MKDNLLKTLQNYKFAIAIFTALLLAAGTSAQAQTSYTGTASTGAWNSTRWNNTSDTSPYGSAWLANNAASFAAGAYTFTAAGTTGQVVNIGNITLAGGATVTFSGAGGTIATSATRTLDIGVGSLLNFGTQAMSTAVGTGFIKSGAGVLATAGGGYSGGFTLNAGTVIMNGVDAMGASASNVLTLNGGTVASGTSRSMTTAKYGGGIVIGGNVQFGELVTNVALADSAASLSFANNVSLGTGVRTFTLGNNGVQTFSGIISNTSGGITFSANAGVTGNFGITGNVNTFTGPINITAGEVRFTSDGSIGNGANDIIIDGGRFGKANDANTVTLGSGRDIFVGDGVGTAISTAGTGVLIYNRAIANKAGEIGSWAKKGTGTLSLGGESTYSGDTAINEGILLLTTGNDRLPTGTVVSLGQAASANVGTLNLNGLNQQIAGLASTTGINSSANKNTVTSATAATLDINVAEGTTRSYGAGTTQNSGVITGLLALTKSGLGTQVLGDANTYSGTTTVNAGTLVVNGSITSSPAVVNGGLLNVNGTAAAVTVNSGGSLGGSGIVGAISGAGTVGPGNSPGILTATSVNPNAGTDFRFEFTALNPTYTSAIASGNDLLHLTSSSSPFAGGTFTSGNIISIYLNSSSITDSLLAGQNTTFSGGFFVDGTFGIAAALSPASFAYYTTSSSLGTGSAVNYGGTNYYLLNSEIAAKTTLSNTAVASAGFSTGTVAGTILTFNAVPEPSAQSLLAFGMAALVAVRSLRRKQS